MECYGNLFDERMLVEDEDYDRFSGQELLSSKDDHSLIFESPTMFLPCSNADSFVVDNNVYVSDDFFYHFFSQESSSNDTVPYPIQESFHLCPCVNLVPSPTSNQSIDFCMIKSSQPTPVFPGDALNKSLYLTQDHVAVENVKLENVLALKRNNDKTNKKRRRVSRDNKSKKNMQPKKNQNDTEDGNNNNGEKKGQSSTSCSSDDDLTHAAIHCNEKTRASRGTATDPQSLYARKRREKINERLRILQKLVPNGTKVDISTMLEEAVQYVNFLKLQIQLLSCDDM